MADASSPPRAAHGSPGVASGSIDESIDSIGRMYAELKSRIGSMAPSPKPAAADAGSDRLAVSASLAKRASDVASPGVYDALPPRSPLPHGGATGEGEPISFDVDSSLTTTRNASLSSYTRTYVPPSPSRADDAERETSLVRSRDDGDAEAAIRAAARDLEREQVQVVERTRRLAATLLGRLAAVREEEEARREERLLDVQREEEDALRQLEEEYEARRREIRLHFHSVRESVDAMSKEKIEREAALLKEELQGGSGHSFLASRSQTGRSTALGRSSLGSLSLTLGGGEETMHAMSTTTLARSPMADARQKRREERRQRREAEEEGGKLTREEIKLRHYETVLKKLQRNEVRSGRESSSRTRSSRAVSGGSSGAGRLSSLQQARLRFDMLSSDEDEP